ncbi:MAG: TetR/AcrR family transcriptional regulator [Sneathiella sp.]
MNISQTRMRLEILEAAKNRFVKPGYGKTTMAEIAADVNISAPHLYNFYKGKLDLAVAIADSVTRDHREILRRSLETNTDNGCEPAEVLHSYFQLEFEINFKLQSEQPGMRTLLRLVATKRKFSSEVFRIRFLKDLSVYLNQSMEKKELAKMDPFWMAELLHAATFSYRDLSFPLERKYLDLAKELRGVLDLLMGGFVVAVQKNAPYREVEGISLS